MPGYKHRDSEDDGSFDEKVKIFTGKPGVQSARGSEIKKLIREILKGIGYEF